MPYLNVRQVESALLAAARPPNDPFTELITLPNRTWEGRTCRAIKIANGNDSERMGVYFIGGVHAREWGSPDILISFIHRLIRAYRTNSGLSLGGGFHRRPDPEHRRHPGCLRLSPGQPRRAQLQHDR